MADRVQQIPAAEVDGVFVLEPCECHPNDTKARADCIARTMSRFPASVLVGTEIRGVGIGKYDGGDRVVMVCRTRGGETIFLGVDRIDVHLHSPGAA